MLKKGPRGANLEQTRAMDYGLKIGSAVPFLDKNSPSFSPPPPFPLID